MPHLRKTSDYQHNVKIIRHKNPQNSLVADLTWAFSWPVLILSDKLYDIALYEPIIAKFSPSDNLMWGCSDTLAECSDIGSQDISDIMRQRIFDGYGFSPTTWVDLSHSPDCLSLSAITLYRLNDQKRPCQTLNLQVCSDRYLDVKMIFAKLAWSVLLDVLPWSHIIIHGHHSINVFF